MSVTSRNAWKKCHGECRSQDSFDLARLRSGSLRFITLALWILAMDISNREVSAVQPGDPTTALVRGNSEFALALYAKLSQGDGNRFLSPVSISTALAMTYAGAHGETAEQIAKTLHFSLTPDLFHPAFHRLIAELYSRNSVSAPSSPKQSPDVQLFTANAVWCQSGQRILPDFQKRIEVNYRGGLYPVDFRADTEKRAADDQCMGRGANQGENPGPPQAGERDSPDLVGVDQRHLLQRALDQPVFQGNDSPG